MLNMVIAELQWNVVRWGTSYGSLWVDGIGKAKVGFNPRFRLYHSRLVAWRLDILRPVLT